MPQLARVIELVNDSARQLPTLLEVQPLDGVLKPVGSTEQALDMVGAKIGDLVLLQEESTATHKRVVEIVTKAEVMARESTAADKRET